jgi:phosphomannomutase
VGYDSRYDSQSLSQLIAAVVKAYGIRVYCIDKHTIAPFISYFASKFKCLYGIMVTGRDLERDRNGIMIFNSKGQLVSKEITTQIEKCMIDYTKSHSMVDLSPLFDYSCKKVKFKADNFTDVSMKTYIQDLEDKFLINHKNVNKLCPRIVITSLHGPASDYLKKLFANFGFPNLSTTEA